jgi:hypothetical protein
MIATTAATSFGKRDANSWVCVRLISSLHLLVLRSIFPSPMVVWRLVPGKESGILSSGLVDTRARLLRPSRVKRRDSAMERESIYNEGDAIEGIFLFLFFTDIQRPIGFIHGGAGKNTATRIITNHNGRTTTRLESGRWFK